VRVYTRNHPVIFLMGSGKGGGAKKGQIGSTRFPSFAVTVDVRVTSRKCFYLD